MLYSTNIIVIESEMLLRGFHQLLPQPRLAQVRHLVLICPWGYETLHQIFSGIIDESYDGGPLSQPLFPNLLSLEISLPFSESNENRQLEVEDVPQGNQLPMNPAIGKRESFRSEQVETLTKKIGLRRDQVTVSTRCCDWVITE